MPFVTFNTVHVLLSHAMCDIALSIHSEYKTAHYILRVEYCAEQIFPTGCIRILLALMDTPLSLIVLT